MPPRKGRLSQRQLENLAKGNPKVAKGLKDGKYADRLAGVGEAAPRRRAKPAPVAAAGVPPAGQKKRARAQAAAAAPAAPRRPAAKPKPKPKGTDATRGTDSPPRRRGFLAGLLGGG